MIEFIKSKKTYFQDQLTGDIVIVDTVLSGQHTYTTDVTEFPVASGETISDHAINKPFNMSLVCAVTNTPAVASGGSVHLGSTEYTASAGTNEISAANDAYSKLLTFRDTHAALLVGNGLDTFPDMMITSIVIDLSKKTNHTFYFTIILKKVLFVESQLVDVMKLDSKLADSIAANKNLGNVEAKDDGLLQHSLLYEGGKGVVKFITGEFGQQ